ncbi:MAG: hypothetical protein OEY17_00630 [Nitrosopumilus sp.]|nr:hypothetical protein [Nitrosopumilus sp.]MDH5657840.1 hypothetical protein [Nitrosopumilus sp.]
MHLFFLFLPLILLPVFAEPIPNYDKPYAPIFTDKPVYTWTDKIKMTILAPSWNTDNHLIDSIGDDADHAIKINTSENSLKSYRFTETNVNSGIFTAEITLTGFPHDANGDGDIDTMPRTTGKGPTSGFLEVDRDSSVTISFEFADGVVLVKSVPVTWNVGSISFLKEIPLYNASVMIRVIDPDMNLNPEALDHIQIQIFSDSDTAGIEIEGIETSESSGSFVGTISLSQTLPSSGNRLYALPGDKLSAKYADYTLPKPFSKSDHLEIETFAVVDSSISSTERLTNLPITFSDIFANKMDSFSANTPLQIVGTIQNDQEYKQKFVYLFQVKNANNSVDSISWVQGELSSKQRLDVSQSWVPEKSGIYRIETFVWNSLNDPIPLSNLTSTSITVE